MRYGRWIHGLGMVVLLILAAGPGCTPMDTASAPEASVADYKTLSSKELSSEHRMHLLGQFNAMKEADSMAAPAPGQPVDLGTMSASQPDRHLIKNATILLEVETAQPAAEQIVRAVQEIGGYVSHQNERVDHLGRRNIQITVRVPAQAFDGAMLTLDSLGTVLDRQVNTQDVTEEFVDTEAKLRNLKRTEERILDHLNRTAKLEDILKAEEELSRYREQIERLEGRLRYLGDRVAFSTINITLTEAAKVEPIAPAKAFSSGQVFSQATRSLLVFAQGLWIRIIWLIVWAPVWAILLAAAIMTYRLAKKHNKNRNQPQ